MFLLSLSVRLGGGAPGPGAGGGGFQAAGQLAQDPLRPGEASECARVPGGGRHADHGRGRGFFPSSSSSCFPWRFLFFSILFSCVAVWQLHAENVMHGNIRPFNTYVYCPRYAQAQEAGDFHDITVPTMENVTQSRVFLGDFSLAKILSAKSRSRGEEEEEVRGVPGI